MPNIIDIPTSFNRLEGFPLDQSSVFNTYLEAEEYAFLDSTSYPGQVIFVVDTNQAYIITSTKSLLSLNFGANSIHPFWSDFNSFPTYTFTSNEYLLFFRQATKNGLAKKLLHLSKTSLVTFTAQGQPAVGGSIDASNYINLNVLKCNNLGLNSVYIKDSTNLIQIELERNNLTSIDLSSQSNCTYFWGAFNMFTQSSVDYILTTLSDFNSQASNAYGVKRCALHGGFNASPSSVGQAAKNALSSKGWIVSTN